MAESRAALPVIAGLAVVLAIPLGACSDGGSGGPASDVAFDGAADVEADAADDTGSEADGSADVASDTSHDGASDADPDTPAEDLACLNAGTDGATAGCLNPTQTPEYYVEQAEKYFDTLDISRPEDSVPNYSERVARWEWKPWLLLTGYGSDVMVQTAGTLRDFDPSTVPVRDCRFFEVQPFARCYVEFEYDEGRCPIYEEFVFNDAGEMTFIEAWSDIDGLRPTTDPEDRWAEGPGVVRLSTRIPGLGNAEGLIDLDSEWMTAAADGDETIADFVRRARDFWGTWLAEVAAAGDEYFATGCGW